MNSTILNIEELNVRQKVISQFCLAIAISSYVSTLIYIYLQLYMVSIVTTLIGTLFLFFRHLNKQGHYKVARFAIIITTAMGVAVFSLYVGYDSGGYIYLFTTPLLIYLLYDFSEKLKVIGVMLIYISSYLITVLFKDKIPHQNFLSPEVIDFIYAYNFIFTYMLSFGMILFISRRNNLYIHNLKQQQEDLENEVKQRIKSETLLKKSLNERNLLLSEIHHRVKNNMAVTCALLSLQENKLKNEEGRKAIEETKNRIYAMSMVHNLLFENDDLKSLDMVQFFSTICSNISSGYQLEPKIEIEQNIQAIKVDLDTAIPIGLIFNELITNAFKHAFDETEEGKIQVGLINYGREDFELYVYDNGKGMPENKIEDGNTGMMIVQSLVEQLEGSLHYECLNGSRFTIRIPITDSDYVN